MTLDEAVTYCEALHPTVQSLVLEKYSAEMPCPFNNGVPSLVQETVLQRTIRARKRIDRALASSSVISSRPLWEEALRVALDPQKSDGDFLEAQAIAVAYGWRERVDQLRALLLQELTGPNGAEERVRIEAIQEEYCAD